MGDLLPLEPLELAVLRNFFLVESLPIEEGQGPFSEVSVSERDYTGVGFFTHFNPATVLELQGYGERYLGLDTEAILNGHFHVGFIVYVEKGRVSCIEGHSYMLDCEWPDTVSEFRVLRSGTGECPQALSEIVER